MLDSDAEGDLAAKQDNLVNALGNKRIIRTKDVYSGDVISVEIEDLFRESLLYIAKEQLGWDAVEQATSQNTRPIVDILASVAGNDFSKYKLAKAFLRWSRDHGLADLQKAEVDGAQKLIKKINSALS